MKSKTKTILIFAAILAAAFLIAFLDGGAVQSAADEEEEGTLIGAFVSEEDIDIGGDLAVSAAGKFVWKAGRLYMDTDEDWWALKDRGSGIYCTMEPDSRDGEEDAKSPCITNFGTLGAPQGKTAIDNDNGIRTTDIDLSGEVYACGSRHVIFKFYPIYQTDDGRIYLTRGNSMGMSGADGASITHTLTSDKTETIGGKSERVKVRVAITVAARPTPTKFTVAHMDENDDLLKLEEFAPDALPESITAAPGAAYLIGTSYGTDWNGETAEYDICSRSNDSAPYSYSNLDTFRYQGGKLCSISIKVNWGGGNSMKRLIAFALALAVVFGVSFALYKPERIEAAARETMEDEWVGYFFALEPFDGRRYATETGDDYDFGVPGVPVFVTITAFEPDDPDYEEGSEFNYSVGAAVSDEAVGSGMRVNVDDNGSSYETSGEICYASGEWKPVKQCSVYRTSDGKYYAEWDRTGMGPRVGVSREESVEWKVNGRTERRSIKVSITFEEHTAAESVEFVWMDSDKNVLSRAEYAADALPETLTAPDGASMLVVTQTSADGTSARSLCTQDDLFARAYVPSTLSGLLRVVDVSLDWGENGT